MIRWRADLNGDWPKFSIVLGQRMSWPNMLACALETEQLGFDGLFLVDHFYGLKDLDDPTHEAYTMLAALAPRPASSSISS